MKKNCAWPPISEIKKEPKPKIKKLKEPKPKPVLVEQDQEKVMNKDPKPKAVDMKPYILEALEKLRKQEMANKQPFKARAYATVLGQLKQLDKPIKSLEDISDIKGIGDKIKTKLQEIFETGHLKQVDVYDSDDKMKIYEVLTQVHGIGPSKARDLIDNHQIKTIEELIEKQETLLNDVQKKGLKYYQHFDHRIPRKEMEKHEEYILKVVQSFGKDIKVSITGSYRRKESTSGDIDCLITGCDESVYQQILQKFKDDKYIVDVFAQGNKKVLAVGKLKMRKYFRRVDFMLTQQHEYPFALLYFTGSGPFNVAMRNFALSKGYSLSEYGLKDSTGNFVEHKFKEEKDIFEFLGLKYIAPEERKNIKNLSNLSVHV